MSAKLSRRLVIDASVVRAAGGKDATAPKSKNCHDFLQAVLDICHRMVVTPDIREEWNKHESKFALKWRRTMVAKKKLVYLSDIPFMEDLWEKIEAVPATDKEREAMFKDLLLIKAAIATDNTVISLDDRVRTLFDRAAERVSELRSIVWVNPDKIEDNSIEWLQNGAEPESERLLGFRSPES